MKTKGALHWYIPDGHIPPNSQGELTSHEAICVLNACEENADLTINIYFENRDPILDVTETVYKQRTKHIKTETLQKESKYIPKGVPYALEVKSNIPIIVQYSRLDSTQAANALMTSMAFPT